MICRLCKISARTVATLSTVVLLAIQPAWAQAPKINWSLDEAIRQIERQADDFETGMARNLDLKPELFRDKWPRGTETIKK